ncbi:hypothetical protein NPIL_240111 [Nephila pilipes]|uniref:Uncharacterized protein n=1 Tax=Nephila pilipes TaxID=299642 RepID=A0A8X6MDM2_NEPPI|nr:hypothetical protein NPIL_240111 [Nephila pilipes]
MRKKKHRIVGSLGQSSENLDERSDEPREQRSGDSDLESAMFVQGPAKPNKGNYLFFDELLHQAGKILGQPVTQIVFPKKKCYFARTQIKCLGHIIGLGKHQPEMKKRAPEIFDWKKAQQRPFIL